MDLWVYAHKNIVFSDQLLANNMKSSEEHSGNYLNSINKLFYLYYSKLEENEEVLESLFKSSIEIESYVISRDFS